jgi:hypothetical protein
MSTNGSDDSRVSMNASGDGIGRGHVRSVRSAKLFRENDYIPLRCTSGIPMREGTRNRDRGSHVNEWAQWIQRRATRERDEQM